MEAEAVQSRPIVAPYITGLKRDKIVHALANGDSIRSITRNLPHSDHTVTAIRDGEQRQIAAVKSKLATMFDTLCEKSIRRATKTVGKATYAQACVGAGISAQRSMELRGEDRPAIGLTLNLMTQINGDQS